VVLVIRSEIYPSSANLKVKFLSSYTVMVRVFTISVGQKDIQYITTVHWIHEFDDIYKILAAERCIRKFMAHAIFGLE